MPYKNREQKNAAQARYRRRKANDPAWIEKENLRLKKYDAPKRYCSKCGVSTIRLCRSGMCKSCDVKAKREAKELLLTCKECGASFVGFRSRRYCCLECRMKAFRKMMAGYVVNWERKNPAKARAIHHSYKARKESLPAGFTTHDWERALQFFGYHCAYCGREGNLSQDHFFPVSKGGGYTKNNIVPACRSCNSSKGDKDPRAWLSPTKYRYITKYLGIEKHKPYFNAEERRFELWQQASMEFE